MIRWTDITGLIGVVLFAAAIICYISKPLISLSWRRTIVCITLIVMPLFFWKTSSLMTILRGMTGDLSISSVLFLLLFLSNDMKINDFTQSQQSTIRDYLILACGAIMLYPFALGISNIDTYRLGFGNTYFLTVLACGAIFAYRHNLQLIAWSILFSVAAWTIGWYESTNLWDYLLDPWLSLYAMGILILTSVKYLF